VLRVPVVARHHEGRSEALVTLLVVQVGGGCKRRCSLISRKPGPRRNLCRHLWWIELDGTLP